MVFEFRPSYTRVSRINPFEVKNNRRNPKDRRTRQSAMRIFAEALESRIILFGNGPDRAILQHPALTGYQFNRTDSQVNFSWGATSPGGNLSSSNFSARWEGSRSLHHRHTHFNHGNGGEELWVNGYNIINNWTSHSTQDTSATISLNANTQYAIDMEYFSNTTSAATALSWSVSGGNTALVPAANLYPLTSGPGAYSPTTPNTTAATPSTTGMPAGWSFADIGGSPRPAQAPITVPPGFSPSTAAERWWAVSTTSSNTLIRRSLVISPSLPN